MKNLLTAFLRKLLSNPIAIQTDSKYIYADQQLQLPDGALGASFTNVGEPVIINNVEVDTRGMFIVELSPFEKDVTLYDIRFTGSGGLGPKLLVVWKIPANIKKDL